MYQTDKDTRTVLGQPLELPCGVQLKNRLIKAAMSDSLGDGEGNPTQPQMRLYERLGFQVLRTVFKSVELAEVV